MVYFWLKAGHLVFVIFWMAGLFMLPRLFVYHQEADPDSPENAKWIERERKLIRIILMPSIGAVWVLAVRSMRSRWMSDRPRWVPHSSQACTQASQPMHRLWSMTKTGLSSTP